MERMEGALNKGCVDVCVSEREKTSLIFTVQRRKRENLIANIVLFFL